MRRLTFMSLGRINQSDTRGIDIQRRFRRTLYVHTISIVLMTPTSLCGIKI